MRIGDRVRLLHGTEEGRIVAIKGKIVDVEIDDGFIIPALQNEVVLIDKNEANNFQKEIQVSHVSKPDRNDDFIADGIYLGLEEIQENFFEGFLINQTDHTILFSLSQYDKKAINGLAFGIAEAYTKKPVGQLTSSIFNDSKQLFAQVTNPPIDPIRERLVMSLATFVGNNGNMLIEDPLSCHTVALKHPGLIRLV